MFEANPKRDTLLIALLTMLIVILWIMMYQERKNYLVVSELHNKVSRENATLKLQHEADRVRLSIQEDTISTLKQHIELLQK